MSSKAAVKSKLLVTFILLATCSGAIPKLPIFASQGYIGYNDTLACPLGHIYVSAEDWWRRELLPESGSFGNATDFGHVHLETCFPQMVLFNGSTKVTTVLHENPGVVKLNLQKIGPSLPAPRMVAQCEASGGKLVPTVNTIPDCKWTDDIIMNGYQYFSGPSPLSMISNAYVPERTFTRMMRTAITGMIMIDDSSGLPPKNVNPHDPRVNYLMGTGWSSGSNYTRVTLFTPPKVPLGGMYRFYFVVDPMGNLSTPISRHIVALNANFHMLNPGRVLRNASGEARGMLSVNLHGTEALGPSATGWHKMTIQGKALDKTGSTNTGSLSLRFQVSTGEKCQVPVQTFGKSNANLWVKKVILNGNEYYRYASSSPPAVLATCPIIKQTDGPVQNVALISYDLSFMKAPSGLGRASIFLWVNNVNSHIGATLQAFSASENAPIPEVPCLPGFCAAAKLLGQATLGASYNWIEIRITDRSFLNRQLCCKKLDLAFILVSNVTQAIGISVVEGLASPPAILIPSCSTTRLDCTSVQCGADIAQIHMASASTATSFSGSLTARASYPSNAEIAGGINLGIDPMMHITNW